MTDADIVFPSQEWSDQYKEAVNNSDEYREASSGWGVDFNGDFIFRMTDLPIDDLDMDAMPEDLRSQIEQYTFETDREGYVWLSFISLEDGECQEVYPIESEDEVDAGFVLSGSYDDWISLMRGEIGPIDGMMSGKLELDGDMQKVLQYSDSATILNELAASIDAEFIHETYA